MATPRDPRARFRSTFRIFEDSAEKNPNLPSYFQEEHLCEKQIEGADFPAAGFRNEFEFYSSKGFPILDGATLSLKHIVQFQAMVRGHLERKCDRKANRAIVLLQANTEFSSSKALPILEGATPSLQHIVQFQAMVRGHLERKCDRKSNRAIVLLQASTRRFLQDKFLQEKGFKSAAICQPIVRGYLARKEQTRLEDIRNPPLIRKMRTQIAATRMKLDAINEEREKNNLERERRKAEIRKEVQQMVANEERNKALGISYVKTTGSQVISYLRTENIALRDSMKDSAQGIVDIRAENEWLERDTQVVNQYTHELHSHYKKLTRANGVLQKKVIKLRTDYKPRFRDALLERRNYVSNEARQKYIYRQGVFKIIDHLCLEQSCDSEVKDSLFQIIRKCEVEFDYELDLDTPLHLFPTVQDSDPVFLDYVSDEEDLSLGDYDEKDFEWIDDSHFILPEVMQLNAKSPLFPADENYSASCDSPSIGSSSSSSSSSDSSSSTSSSDSESVLSVTSHLPEKIDDTGKSIEEYIELNADSPLSPINTRNSDTYRYGEISANSSTSCSTESAYEVESVANNRDAPCSSEESKVYCDPEHSTDNSDVDDNHEDVSVPSIDMSDWRTATEREGGSMKYPSVITVTTKTDLDWKLNRPVDSYTLASTTCTTAMESDCTSNFSDDDMEFQNEETNHQIYQSALSTIETADDRSEYVSVATDMESHFEVDSQAGDKRAIHSGPKEVNEAVEQTRILPRQEQKTSVPESKTLDASACPAVKDLVLQRGSKGPHPSSQGSGTNHCPVAPPTFNARSAPVRSQPSIPVNARHPSIRVPNPQPTVEKAKPFLARPAPKSNSPKIPVRLRNPSKLRSLFRARPAPTIALPKIPVRDRNPLKLRSAA
jgi:hypothetical protein